MTDRRASDSRLAPSVNTKSSITRRRTGCISCRERRVRCDENRPTCNNCMRKSRNCTWTRDLRFIHHGQAAAGSSENDRGSTTSPQAKRRRVSTDSQFSALEIASQSFPSSHDSTAQTASEPQSSPSIKDSGPALLASPETTADRSESVSSLPRSHPDPPDLTWSGTSGSSEGGTLPEPAVTAICRSEAVKLRDSIQIEHESPLPPNLEPNPDSEEFTDWRTLQASDVVQEALKTDLEVRLLQNYIWECAPWFDAYDSQRRFAEKDVSRMMTCPPWRAAALALSAKNIELRNGSTLNSDLFSLHLYQLAVRLAIDSISGRFDCVGTLAGCVLLSVYEMMTVHYTDWRRHLQGCASIYEHNVWNGSSGGLISASFWNYAIIDVWAAFCAGTHTLLPPTMWFTKTDEIMAQSNVDRELHAQVATWLLARTVNLVHSSRSPGPLQTAEINKLHSDLALWEAMGSADCGPVIQRDASREEDIPFPRLLFASHSSALGHLMFHTATVLLLELEQAQASQQNAEMTVATYEHAQIACGIIETNDNTPCLVHSLQPLWICGRYLRTRAEKFAALEILAQIERRTGWKCSWRSNSLREFWKLC